MAAPASAATAAAPASASAAAPLLSSALVTEKAPDSSDGSGVEVRYISAARGRGLFARRPFKKGDIIMTDSPLAAIQFHTSIPRVKACGECMRIIGSLPRLLHQLSGQPIAKFDADSDAATATAPPLPFLPNPVLTPVIKCEAGCDTEYCSDECRTKSWHSHHAILCTGYHNPRRKSLLSFIADAIYEHQFFIQAARLIAMLMLTPQTACASTAGATSKAPAPAKAAPPTANPTATAAAPTAAAMSAAASPASSFAPFVPPLRVPTETLMARLNECIQREWWHLTDGDYECPPDEAQRYAKRISKRSFELLLASWWPPQPDTSKSKSTKTRAPTPTGSGAVSSTLACATRFPTPTNFPAARPNWLTLSYFGRICGVLRLNNLMIELASPLRDYVLNVDKLAYRVPNNKPPAAPAAAAAAAAATATPSPAAAVVAKPLLSPEAMEAERQRAFANRALIPESLFRSISACVDHRNAQWLAHTRHVEERKRKSDAAEAGGVEEEAKKPKAVKLATATKLAAAIAAAAGSAGVGAGNGGSAKRKAALNGTAAVAPPPTKQIKTESKSKTDTTKSTAVAASSDDASTEAESETGDESDGGGDSAGDETTDSEDEDSVPEKKLRWTLPQRYAQYARTLLPGAIGKPPKPDAAASADSKGATAAAAAAAPAASAASASDGSVEPGVLKFQSTLFPSLHGSGLFNRVCYMNHSCDPSAEVMFASVTPRVNITAFRDVAIGDEITISYIDTENTTPEERRTDLFGTYQFTCDCTLCLSELNAKAAAPATATATAATPAVAAASTNGTKH